MIFLSDTVSNFPLSPVYSSSDDIVEAILAMEDEVQSCEVISMNVL